MNQFSRIEMLLGKEKMDKLKSTKVLIFGIGGVGGYTMEALARSGVGHLGIVDKDKVDLTNLNRQIIADHNTIGQLKVDAAEKRLLSINPDLSIDKYPIFYLPETENEIDFSNYDYIVDAVDTVKAKLLIIEKAYNLNKPVISAMGCGNRLDPSKLTITEIEKTEMDPLAKIMRKELKLRGIKKVKVAYSTEIPLKPSDTEEEPSPGKKTTPGSTAFVPSACGLLIASRIIRDLTED